MSKQTEFFYTELRHLVAYGRHYEIITKGEAVIHALYVLINNTSDAQIADVLSAEIGYVEAIVKHAYSNVRRI